MSTSHETPCVILPQYIMIWKSEINKTGNVCIMYSEACLCNKCCSGKAALLQYGERLEFQQSVSSSQVQDSAEKQVYSDLTKD